MSEILGSIIGSDKLSGKDGLVLALCSVGIYGIVEIVKGTIEIVLAEK